MKIIRAAVLFFSCFGACANAFAGPCYDVQWFWPSGCSFGLFPAIHAWGLNDAGMVVGSWPSCDGALPDRPFLYSAGTLTQLPNGGADAAEALALNNTGIIVGAADLSDQTVEMPAIFSSSSPILLPVPPGTVQGYANAVNDEALIAGYRVTPGSSGFQAALWHDGQFVDLAARISGPSSEANDVSQDGVVVGWFGTESSGIGARGFIWDNGHVTVIPAVPATGGLDNSSAFAINRNGTVLVQGMAWTTALAFRTYLWSDGKYSEMLGWPEGYTQSRGFDINDHGDVIGVIRNYPQGTLTRAAVLRDGVMCDLNGMFAPGAPVGTLTQATAINNTGQIAGWGVYQGHSAGFLLTPRIQPADLSGDCHVSSLDLMILLRSWGPVGARKDAPGTTPITPAADINHDGIVNGIDLALLLGAWG